MRLEKRWRNASIEGETIGGNGVTKGRRKDDGEEERGMYIGGKEYGRNGEEREQGREGRRNRETERKKKKIKRKRGETGDKRE